MKRGYTPRVYRSLHRCLAITAWDRGTSVDRLTNGILYRGLLCESLSGEALNALPHWATSGAELSPGSIQTDELSRARYKTLSSWVRQISDRAAPFESVDQLRHWYESSVLGVGRGLLSANLATRTPAKRSPSELKFEWRYETTVLYLNQVYGQTLSYLLGRRMRDSSLP